VLLDWKATGFWASTSSLPLAAHNCTKIKKLHNYKKYGHAFFYPALPVARHTSLQEEEISLWLLCSSSGKVVFWIWCLFLWQFRLHSSQRCPMD